MGTKNFGIISEITYQIIEVPSIIQYSIHWNWSEAAKVLHQWSKESLQRPIQFNEDLALFNIPLSNEKEIELSGYYVIPKDQSEKDAIKKIHSQLDSLGGDLIIKPAIPYSQLYTGLVINRQYYNFSIIQTMFTDIIQSKDIVKLINEAKGRVSISFTLLGGKIINKSTKTSAFYPRKKHFFVDVATSWNTMIEGQEIEEWTDKTVKTLINIDCTYVYVGFPITFTNIKYENTIYFGKHYPALQKIKKYYDPLNIFTHTGTINP